MLRIQRSDNDHITATSDDDNHYEIPLAFLRLIHVALTSGHSVIAIHAIRATYPMPLADAKGLTVWIDICNKRSNLFTSSADADAIWN